MFKRLASATFLALALAACAGGPGEPLQDVPAPAEAPTASPRVVLVLAPASRPGAEIEAQLDRALLARAQGSPLVRAARLERRGDELELALDLARGLGEDELAQLAHDLTSPDTFEIAIVAREEDGIDLGAERDRMEAWCSAHPGAPLAAFARVERDDGGPHPDVRWVESNGAGQAQRLLLLVQNNPAWTFTSEDVAQAYRSVDPQGHPAVGFELHDARKQAFGDFTEANVDRAMAILVDGDVVSVATINDRLPGQGIVLGRFTAEEADSLARVLSAGAPLPVPVQLVEVRRG